MNARTQICLVSSILLLSGLSLAALAKHDSSDANENMAVILGETGERYPLYGAGGIRVSGGHHGIFSSNMKTSAIEIDGSGISGGAQRLKAFNLNTDFTAAPTGAYFVSQTCVCTFPSAAGAAGQEILVCNTGKGITIRYQPAQGENIMVASGAPLANTTDGKIDRFISDGKCWYRE